MSASRNLEANKSGWEESLQDPGECEDKVRDCRVGNVELG